MASTSGSYKCDLTYYVYHIYILAAKLLGKVGYSELVFLF